MATLTKSGPIEIWLDRIGDYNPQLMRELRGQLKFGPMLTTVGAAIAAHGFMAFLYFSFAEKSPPGIPTFLIGFLQALSPLTIVISCHQLLDNLATEVQQGTINPLRLSPQTAGQILWGKALGTPVLTYLFNLLCLPAYVVLSVIAQVPLDAIGVTLIISFVQMVLWLSVSLFLGLALRQPKTVTTLIGTIVVLCGLGIQGADWLPLPWTIGIALQLAGSYLFWHLAKKRFHFERGVQVTANLRSSESPSSFSQLTANPSTHKKIKSAATPAKDIAALKPIFDRIGDINPQLMRELRGRLTANSVLWILSLSIVLQIFLVGYNITDWLPVLQQWSIVLGCYQLIRNWSAEEDQGTFNPIRLSPQSAGQIIWGKLLGVPSLVYLFNLSCLPLYLIANLGSLGSPIGAIISLAIAPLQAGFWFSASLLFASLAAKTPGAKAILGAVLVGLLLFFQNLIAASAVGAVWYSPVLGFFGSVLVSWAGSYLCWQAIGRRFHRPSATLWSKGQTYGMTTIATLCVLPFGLDGLPILPYLLLVQGFLLIQPRQVLFDWARRPAAQLQPATIAPAPGPSLRRSAQRQDLIWGESSPPLLAMGVHVGTVTIGVGAYCLWNIGAIGSVLSQNSQSLIGALLVTNLMVLSVGLTQLLQLFLRRQALAQSLSCNFIFLILPLFGLAQISGDNPVGLLTLFPWAALAAQAPGYTIAALCLQWIAIAVVYRQFDRCLNRLAKSDFARSLEPSSIQP